MKELKKRVRGVRELERAVTDPDDSMTEVVQGYCQAVRSALTDDGRPPLDAAGIQLQQRLSTIEHSLGPSGKKGGLPKPKREVAAHFNNRIGPNFCFVVSNYKCL